MSVWTCPQCGTRNSNIRCYGCDVLRPADDIKPTDDDARLAEIRQKHSGRTRYERQPERDDEFLLRKLDEARAERDGYKLDYDDTVECLRNERNKAVEIVAERDALAVKLAKAMRVVDAARTLTETWCHGDVAEDAMTAEERLKKVLSMGFRTRIPVLKAEIVAAMNAHAAEARADERKKLVAMLREPSDDTREALMTATWEATPAEIEALIKVLADLLERAP